VHINLFSDIIHIEKQLQISREALTTMGTATTTIYTIEPLSEQYTQPPQVFQNQTEVSIADPFTGQTDPYTGQTLQEDNPFELVVSSTTTTGVSAAGGINLFSSAQADNGFFLQYWDIDIVSNTGDTIEFKGVLQQEYRGQALAINQINTSSGARHNVTSVPGLEGLAVPETISEGTTIRGSFSSDETDFSAIVEGYTVDLDYFSVEINDTMV
jgi:hypothetical protein